MYKRNYFKVNNIRLTLDEKITYKKITSRKISDLSTFDNHITVELKYNKEQLVNPVFNNFPFERIRFSKYCRGIEFVRLNYCNDL